MLEKRGIFQPQMSMGNIYTYVQQNAKDTLSERPLTPVDELVLCYLVYYDFDGIVPTIKQGGSISLSEAARLYQERRGDTQTNVNAPFLQHIAAAPRFADAVLSDYEEMFRKSRVQFAAIRIRFAEGTEYIAFRGVDTSLTGWQEAFRASYSPSPAQRLAASYLNRQLRGGDESSDAKRIIIGGHSKGGNMALYAACACEDEARDRIERITLFDSPGLAPGLFSEERYREIKDRIVRLTPSYSLIGRLFMNEEPDRIVGSNVEGLLQHEPLYWKVEGETFVEAKADKKSEKDAQILNRWIARTNMEERQSFTRDLFRVLREKREAEKARGVKKETTAPRSAGEGQSRLELLRFVMRAYSDAARPTRSAARKFLREVIASKFRRGG